MQTHFNGTEQIGSLVAGFPGASNVLKAYGIDFCCGGNRSLQTAIDQQRLNGDEVLHRLNEAYREDQERQETGQNWQDASFHELITHIVETHHDFLREELPVISGFLTKILRVHGPHEPEKLGRLHQLFHTIKSELDEHLIAEEEGQFPLILSY
ncbi:DUF542 domain-containing protein, partial [Gorillibacterium massiliense]|uniref:DUF542 domain-containing protein n=1 Tax=Gorillibacterium massiliense TaxID=1280390 RepID=UPI000592F823